MEIKTLVLNDPEKETQYTVQLSAADHERVYKDHHFALAVLRHARSEAEAERKALNPPEKTLEYHERVSNDSTTDLYLHTSQAEEYQFQVSETDAQLVEESENVSECILSRGQIICSHDQIVCLIDSMAVHISEYDDPRRRKHIFENVANDLISAGFTVDAIQVKNKWKSLTRSYNKAKDTKTRTGQGPTRFLFFEKMEDMLGNKPSNKCSHSINSMNSEPKGELGAKTRPDPNAEDIQKTQEETVSVVTKTSIETDVDATKENKKRKRNAEKSNDQSIMNLRREEYQRKQIRHEERVALERERLDIEKQKLKVLREFIAQRRSTSNE